MPEKPPAARTDPTSKAATLAAALPYMRRYAGKTVVVKYGGHAMGDDALGEFFAQDVVLLKQVGINPIVVHGGGPQIGQLLERLKIKSSFVNGLRVTDRETVEIVEMVLSGSINKQIVSSINAVGGVAAAVKAARLLLLTDVIGVLDKSKKLLTELSSEEALGLIADGTIQGGMIPKIETCLDAVAGGVEAAVIIDGRVPHAILLELFAEGAGTLIRRSKE